MIGSISGGITNKNHERKIIYSITGFLGLTLVLRAEYDVSENCSASDPRWKDGELPTQYGPKDRANLNRLLSQSNGPNCKRSLIKIVSVYRTQQNGPISLEAGNDLIFRNIVDLLSSQYRINTMEKVPKPSNKKCHFQNHLELRDLTQAVRVRIAVS